MDNPGDSVPADTANRLLACLRLARTPKVGPITFQKLIELYKSPEEAVYALSSGECGRLRGLCSLYDAEKEIDLSEKIGAKLISIFDKEYPKMLSHIYDPPPIITVLGDAKLLNHVGTVAIVGSRDASVNGRKIAYDFASGLFKSKFVTVSGLARGIDSAVHSVAFERVPTIAVTASGINVIYPRENARLYKSIPRNGGLVITELSFSSLPKANLFPQRNRIISGLSLGVIVIEASSRSGSLITANLAMSQGKDVFAVPGSPLDHKCSGSNNLIRSGASLVESVQDVIDALNFSSNASRAGYKQNLNKHTVTDDGISKNEDATSTTKHRVMRYLSFSPTSIEDLMAYSKLSISELLSSIAELELLGKVKRLPENMFMLTK